MVFKSKEICLLKLSRSILCTISGGIGSKTTNECGDDWRRLYTTTYDWRRVHTSGCHAGEECIRVHRGLDTSTYQNLKTGDEYIPVGRAYHERSGLKLQTSAGTTGDEYIPVGILQETSTIYWPGGGKHPLPPV